MNLPITNPYQQLALRLDALPNGFPPAPDGSELELLQRLFTPEQAALAARLRLTLETPDQLAARLGGDAALLRKQLKEMARRGLINAGPVEGGVGFGLMPFVVGIYEMQVGRLDAETAQIFERYYRQVFGRMIALQPSVHRVIPVQESVKRDLEVRPYESAAAIIAGCQAWGVVDCICRKQKALIGQPCEHPLDVCMVLSTAPGAFDHSSTIRPLTQEEAKATLRRAAEAGLVHSVSNNQKDLWYICNCCTCSCGILRGMADLGIANVIARSAYVNTVDADLCILCGSCVEACPFDALALDTALMVSVQRCNGCGVCTIACTEGALTLVLRPEVEQPMVPATAQDWLIERAAARGQDLADVT
jgi:ferredoxin